MGALVPGERLGEARDLVGRAHLANPHYPYQAAQALKKEKPSWVLPAPYAHWLERCRMQG